MNPVEWTRRKLFGSSIPEKETIVAQIEHETENLNGAVESLTLEVGVVKQHRMAMSRILDDALELINKEYRK